jgi:hypothetical protein
MVSAMASPPAVGGAVLGSRAATVAVKVVVSSRTLLSDLVGS